MNDHSFVFVQIKQAEIKRQYKEAYNTQSLQYKAMKEKLRQEYLHASSSSAREELDSRLKALKDEQRRKFDALYIRFEEAVQTMLAQQNVNKIKINLLFC